MRPLNHDELSGTEVRRRRIAIGWSRDQLASKVGVQSTEIAEWELGDHPIECTVAVRYALENAEEKARGR